MKKRKIGGYNCTCNEGFSGKGVDREIIKAEGNDILVRTPGCVKDREGKDTNRYVLIKIRDPTTKAGRKACP